MNQNQARELHTGTHHEHVAEDPQRAGRVGDVHPHHGQDAHLAVAGADDVLVAFERVFLVVRRGEAGERAKSANASRGVVKKEHRTLRRQRKKKEKKAAVALAEYLRVNQPRKTEKLIGGGTSISF